jgi:hypothetical protein
MIVKEYDEQNDAFIVENETTGESFPVDAGSLANLLNMHDEPHEFIGLHISVSYQVQA